MVSVVGTRSGKSCSRADCCMQDAMHGRSTWTSSVYTSMFNRYAEFDMGVRRNRLLCPESRGL